MVDGRATLPTVIRDHGFHTVKIKHIVRETDEASSFVLEIPAELRAAFDYQAGQFCTFRVSIDGEQHLRCYSMSTSPNVDDEFQVTVKRVAGGIVSNWMNDVLAPGDPIEVTLPAGIFCLTETDRELVAYAGGSGITPIISIVKTALVTTSRPVHLLYANRDSNAVIFARELEELIARDPERIRVTHHFDVDGGFVDEAKVWSFVEMMPGAEHYICGPGPFMDVVERTLLTHDVDPARIRIERFTPSEPVDEDEGPSDASTEIEVTIKLRGRTGIAQYRPGTTILQTARQLGMSPPFSCEAGSCASCMAKLVEGTVTMYVNNALTPEEVEEGWILTCQSVPVSSSVRVVYE
jgi:3-ketosteroid 9alpha-monooxygenase subunit B